MSQVECKDVLFGLPRGGIVMDPVQGGIKLFRHERAVIDHALFQRLRHVHQTSLLSTVFPGCTHTRFEHSVGTMRIAGKLFRNVVRSYLRELDSLDSETHRKVQEVANYAYCCFRLAALLHDTGHAPFSHQFEDCKAVKDILSNATEVLNNLWESEDWKDLYDGTPGRLKHEHYSVRCAHKILSQIDKLPVEPTDVLSVMDKTQITLSARLLELADGIRTVLGGAGPEDTLRKFWRCLKSLLSGKVDVDKMDYMLRDSYYSGTKYGIYNLDHLTANLRIGWDGDWVGPAITQKGIGTFEDFVYSRFQLYHQIYSHKTAVGFTWLLEKAIDEVLRVDTSTIPEFLKGIARFEQFFESYFWEQFRTIAGKHSKSACARLIRREKLKHIRTERFREGDLPEPTEEGDEIQKSCSAKFYKILPDEDVRVLVEKPNRTVRHFAEAEGRVFQSFPEEVVIVHYFERPPVEGP